VIAAAAVPAQNGVTLTAEQFANGLIGRDILAVATAYGAPDPLPAPVGLSDVGGVVATPLRASDFGAEVVEADLVRRYGPGSKTTPVSVEIQLKLPEVTDPVQPLPFHVFPLLRLLSVQGMISQVAHGEAQVPLTPDEQQARLQAGLQHADDADAAAKLSIDQAFGKALNTPNKGDSLKVILSGLDQGPEQGDNLVRTAQITPASHFGAESAELVWRYPAEGGDRPDSLTLTLNYGNVATPVPGPQWSAKRDLDIDLATLTVSNSTTRVD
jgi:hypothetical protein